MASGGRRRRSTRRGGDSCPAGQLMLRHRDTGLRCQDPRNTARVLAAAAAQESCRRHSNSRAQLPRSRQRAWKRRCMLLMSAPSPGGNPESWCRRSSSPGPQKQLGAQRRARMSLQPCRLWRTAAAAAAARQERAMRGALVREVASAGMACRARAGSLSQDMRSLLQCCQYPAVKELVCRMGTLVPLPSGRIKLQPTRQ